VSLETSELNNEITFCYNVKCDISAAHAIERMLLTSLAMQAIHRSHIAKIIIISDNI